jgi:hypothetical protein
LPAAFPIQVHHQSAGLHHREPTICNQVNCHRKQTTQADQLDAEGQTLERLAGRFADLQDSIGHAVQPRRQ